MENRLMEMLEMKMFSRKKRRIALLAAIVSCLAVIASGTFAYFVAEETNYNVITTGSLAMDLIEETADGEPWPENGVHGVMPGEFVDKVAYVKNTGDVDFYARISLEKIITAAEGVTDELNFNGITLDINDGAWTERDGFYYYNAVLKPGEATEPLFTRVSFSGELGNEYMNARVQINVRAQAVQSRNNGGSALEASGWTDNEFAE